MARANLLVSSELQAQFMEAQSSNSVAWIRAEIVDVNIVPISTGPSSGNRDEDITSASATLDDKPCYLLFCLNPKQTTKRWLLCAYVPDTSKVRAKMLYAAGREDVKKHLGQSHFAKSEFHLSEPSDLTPAGVDGALTRFSDDAPLTEMERMAKDAIHQSAPAPLAMMGGKGAFVPFACSDEYSSAMADFATGKFDFVEISVSDDETIQLENAASLAMGDTIGSKIGAQTDPRYFLIRHQQAKGSPLIFFVYLCPDVCKVRTRMVYSTGKATVINLCEELSVSPDKMLEVRDGTEVDNLILEETSAKADAPKLSTPAFSKPRGPGRGKARMHKKKSP